MSSPLKHKSAAMTEGPSRAPARAMLKATGLTDADLARPLVGIANTWIEIGPCNFHLRRLAQHVKDGVREAGVGVDERLALQAEPIVVPLRPGVIGAVIVQLAGADRRSPRACPVSTCDSVGREGQDATERSPR